MQATHVQKRDVTCTAMLRSPSCLVLPPNTLSIVLIRGLSENQDGSLSMNQKHFQKKIMYVKYFHGKKKKGFEGNIGLEFILQNQNQNTHTHTQKNQQPLHSAALKSNKFLNSFLIQSAISLLSPDPQ